MPLPTEKTPPKQSLSDLTALIHGPSKFGKSSWCSHAPDALFLATEPGLNHLSVYQLPVDSWEELLAACQEIAEGKHPFKTIIIDTVDNAYRACVEYILKKHKIEHESDLGYGKGYALVNNEFQRVLTKLAFLPYGLFLVSHSVEKEIETRTGKHTRVIPTLPDKARKFVLGLVDMILFCDQEVTRGEGGEPVYRRVMRTKPHPNYEAGDRTGRLPAVIDLDFEKFLEAFDAATGKAAPGRAPAGKESAGKAPAGKEPAGKAPTDKSGPAAGAKTQTSGATAAAAS